MDAINKCDVDVRKDMYAGAILTGERGGGMGGRGGRGGARGRKGEGDEEAGACARVSTRAGQTPPCAQDALMDSCSW